MALSHDPDSLPQAQAPDQLMGAALTLYGLTVCTQT